MADLRPLTGLSFVHTADAMSAQLDQWDTDSGYSADLLALDPPQTPERGNFRERLFWADLASLDAIPYGDARRTAMETLADKTFTETHVGDLEHTFWNGN